MKTTFFATAALALVLAAPASAQLLGGGLGGGLGGMGGSIGGTLGGAVERGRTSVDATGRVRGSTRVDRTLPGATNPRAATATGDAALTGSTRLGERRIVTSPSAGADTGVSLLRTRGAVAATGRGMRRVAATAAGVQVFVPATAAVAAPAVAARRIAYPAYGGGYYYEPGAVFVEQRYVDTYMDRQQRDLETSLRGSGATVQRRGDDLVVMLPADVTFAFDKADVRPRFYGVLDAFARTMDAYPGTDVEVVGHTDAIGSDAYNLDLSERRGRSVADFLVQRDVGPARLVVEAMGESEPIASNASVKGRAANRRVELIVHPRAG